MIITSLLRISRRKSSLKHKVMLGCCIAVLGVLAVPYVQRNVSAAAGPQTVNNGRIWLQEPHPFSSNYQGGQAARKALTSGNTTPLSLTTADFDEDGMDDLAAGYATSSGGLLAIHPGNRDAVSPQSLDTWKAIAAGNFPPAFRSTATVIPVPDRPDFIASGNIVGTGHADLLAAARNGSVIDVLGGDGKGHFQVAQSIAVGGSITALTAGNFGMHGPFSHVFAGVKGQQQSFLLLYAGSEDGPTLQARFVMPAPPEAIAVGDLNGDGMPDAAILAGGQMFILHSTSAAGKPVLEPLNVPVSGSAFALGRFVFDRDPRLQIGLLSSDGSVHVVVHSGIDSRFWTADELAEMRKNRTRPRSRVQASLAEGWTVAESLAGVAPLTSGTQPPLVLSLRNSGYGQDDIITLNGDAGQMTMIAHPNSKPGDVAFSRAERSVRPYAGKPVAVAAMRVNADGRKGMVMLHQGQVGPVVMEPLPDPTFVVNVTGDTVDAHPGDGHCADAQGNCSLRAAVMEANASPGVDTIVVPAGTFTLTIPDNGLGNASGGHLDITDGVNIIGASMSTTIIQAGTNASNGIDKVFSVNPNGTFASFDTLLSNMTIQFGRNTSAANPFGGGFDWDAGTNGTGNITLSSVNLNSNSIASSSANISDGGGALFSNIVGGTTGTVTVNNSMVQNNVAQDGGGGIWVGSTVPLSITSTQFSNNQAVGGGSQTGGGLLVFGPSGSTQSQIHSSTISGNLAGVQGGGLYSTEGVLIDKGTIITGNRSNGDGGGIWSNNSVETTTVNNSTITSNTAAGFGGGIEVDSNSPGNGFSMTFSRIVGNGAATGSGLNNIAGSVNVADNWWGCNTGPSAAPCDVITGTATFTPWITMTHTASPASIASGANTTLTASFLQDSNNGPIAASNLGALVGVPITFGNAVNGTISNAQTTIQPTGTATATFTATAGPAAHADATVDHATVTANIVVGGFTISLSPATQTPLAGTSTSYTVTVSPIGGFSGTVTLSTSGCPSNTTCTLTSTSIPNASGTSTLNVSTTTSTVAANSTLTVTGTSGTSTASGTAVLSVQDFQMKITPATASVNAGSCVTYIITVTRLNGFTGTVTPSISGLPAGATATFNPTTIGGRVTSSTLTVCTSTTTPAANTTFTISGVSGGQSRTVTATLSVTDFTISVSPASQTVNAGASTTYTVTVNPLNSFTGTVTPTVSGLPTGATVTFNPTTINVTSGAATSTMTVATSSTTPAANSSLVVNGTSGPLSHNAAAVNLSVQDFSITPPSLACILANSGVSGTVTVAGLNGFTGSATISITGLPTGAMATLNPASFTINGSVTTTLSITTSASTPGGNYPLTITVTSNGVTHTATVTLCVQNFTIAISPAAPAIQNLNAGGSVTYKVTVSPVNGFTGVVNLSQSGLPVGSALSATFSPSSITITNTNPQSSTLTVSTTSALAGAAYPFTVTGTIGNLSQTATGATLNVQNFTLSINPTTMSVITGASTSATVTATPVNGYTGTLNCTVSGLPAGATATCPSITINGTSAVSVTLTINTSTTTPAVSSVLTVTYTDQAKGFPAQSVNPTLNTQSFAISLSPASQAINVNASATYLLTVTPLNGFTGTVNIACSIAPAGPVFSTPCPSSITITNGSSVSANIVISTSQSTTSGQNYTITATGTSVAVPALSKSTTATLIVRDFALSITPASQSVTVNGTVSYTVAATSINGFSGVVALSCTGTLSGAVVGCSPGTINIPSGSSGTTTLTVATSGLTAPGTFSVSATASGGGVNHGASASITVTDAKSFVVLGTNSGPNVNSGGSSTFTVTVNGFSKSATYCPADTVLPSCRLPNGTLVNNGGTIMQALVNAFNSDSSSPVTASLTNGVTLTSKTAGVLLSVTTNDDGGGGSFSTLGFLGVPVVSTLNSISLTVTGGQGPNAPSGTSSTFTVSINNFSKSVTYCGVGTILPSCTLPNGTLVADASTIMQSLVNAFNSDSNSPVTAALTSAGVTFTAKTSGTLLTIGSSDDAAGGQVPAIGFLGIQTLPNPNTAILQVVGSVSSNVGSGSSSTYTVSINSFSKSITYCGPGTTLPSCRLPNGTLVADAGTVMQAIVNALNSDSNSPVTASLSAAGVVMTAKSPGTVLTVFGNDDGASGQLTNYGFIGFPQAP